MAYKKIGGWIVKDKLFTQIKFANELWYFSNEKHRQYHLIFIGWYDESSLGVLFTINILWISLQIGFPWYRSKRK